MVPKQLLKLVVLLFIATAANAAITGRVLSEDGKPLAGASIQAFTSENSRAMRARLVSKTPERTPLATATSADDGTFRIDVKNTLLADIAIGMAGRQVIGLQFSDGEDAGAIVIPSAPSRRIRVMAEGKPVPNALVAAGPFTTRTDGQGFAVLPDLMIPTGVVIIHPDFSMAMVSTDKITLKKGIAVRGRVIGPDGAPVEHAVVSISGWPLAETDTSGNFNIAQAPEFWRTVVATAGDRIGMAPEKRTATYDIRLSPAAALVGNVRDGSTNRGVAGVRVDLLPSSEPKAPEFVITDEKGNFSFTPALSGRYDITAMHREYTISSAEAMLPPNGGRVSKVLEARPLTVVRGRLIDEEKKPVSGALVWYGQRGLPPRGNAVMSGPSGEFALKANFTQFLQPIFAIKSGYALATSGPLSRDSVQSPLTITLPRGFPLRVKVVDKQRQPIANAAVTVMGRSDTDYSFGGYLAICENAFSSSCRKTAVDGSTTYRIIENRYDIQIRGDSIATKSLPNQSLTSRSSLLIIEVDRGTEVTGRVIFGDGTPAANVFVRTQVPFVAQARTEADGTFTIRGVAPGRLALTAATSDHPPMQSAPLDVNAPADNVVITLPTPGRIEGRVVNKATRQPITDFQVVVAPRGRAMMRATPNQIHSDDGSFVVDHLPAGPVELRVAASGYVHGTLSDLTVEEGKTISGVDVQLEPGGKLIGRVTASGQPLSGVRVRFGEERISGIDLNATATDGNGEYTIDGMAAGERNISFNKAGYLPKRRSVEVASGKESRLDVDLERGRDLQGRVVDSTGRPISGARIGISSGPPMNYSQAFSDAEGLFKLEGLADGRYTISASKQGYVNANLPNIAVPSSESITLTLDTGGMITGRVIGLTDAEMAAASVFASGAGTGGRTRLEPGGNFTIRGVPDGKIAVNATVAGLRMRQSATKYVEVVNGSAPPVDIDFSAGVTVSGRVTRLGAAITDGSVHFALKRGERPASASIAADGSYQISGLMPGAYSVRVFTGAINYETESNITDTATFDIDIRGATLRGRVIDASSGAPLADARVSIQPSAEVRMGRNAMTDSEGKFVLDALPDAKIDIRATHEKFAPAIQSIVVKGGSAPDVEIQLQPGQSASVRIVDAQSGSPLSGGVSVSQNRKNIAFASAQSDDGTVRLWLSPGTYRASVSARGYIGQLIDLIVPGPEVRVALAQGGSVTILSRGGGRFRLTLVGITKPARETNLARGVPGTIEALMPGRYTVELIDADGVTVKQSYFVDVIAGQTVRLNTE